MKNFCTSLREDSKNIIDLEKKKMLPLAKEELKSHKDAKICYISGKRIFKKLSKILCYWKVSDHCHYTGKYTGAAHSICNLTFNVPNEIPAGSHNCSNCDHYFIIKELANEFEGQFECPGKNTEKVQNFSRSNRKASHKTQ